MGIISRVRSSSGQKSKLSDTELRRLIVENLDSLRRFSFSLTGNGPDGDDLAQNTVERLMQKGVPTDAPFTAWMLRVCKNLWIDQIRSHSKTQLADSDEMERHLEAVDGSAVAMSKARFGEVAAAIEQLDPEQRAVLGLITVEGHSYREASDILEIPIGTVMSRLSRARARLIELTGEEQS
ncbi:MAG: RNA polymerase sigma factor [Wenzhouxiangella sp.]|jgi:RNA polymerase sigma-70 factor (ECF subfamily)|nr:RNA polymerase sigma factor [Wenzhouxiangella sp.]